MSKKTVLIVEPNPLLAQTVSDALRFAGHRTRCAENTAEAAPFLSTPSPDLILLNIGSGELEGLAAARRWKDDPPTSDIPIIGMSTEAVDGEQARIMSRVCVAYCPKPSSVRTIVSLVSAIPKPRVKKKACALPVSVDDDMAVVALAEG
jgi:two-component system, cell cycle response regulator DivK